MLSVAAVALGLVAGLVIGGLGGGGGVLTVPALVFALGQSAQDATTGSVIIVGIASIVGVLARIRGGAIDVRMGIAFAVVGAPAAFLGTLLNRSVSQPVLLLAFAFLTLTAAAAMLLNGRRDGEESDCDEVDGTSGGPERDAGNGSAARPAADPDAGRVSTLVRARPGTRRRQVLGMIVKVLLCGALIGFLTGFLGVGGGFLAVPAMVIVMRMPMEAAIGTSLLVLSLNALSSVASRLDGLALDWWVVVPFAVAAVVGTLVGKRVSDRLPGIALTRAFAGMLVLVGLFVGAQSVIAL